MQYAFQLILQSFSSFPQSGLTFDTAAPPRARGRTHIVTITETGTLGSWGGHATDPIASTPSRKE